MAVAESLMELRRPESDLAQMLGGVEADLLVVCEDGPSAGAGSGPAGVTSYLDYPDYDDELDDDGDDLGDGFEVEGYDEPATLVAAGAPKVHDEAVSGWVPPVPRQPAPDPELPGLRMHRLGLIAPLTSRHEPDLIAAMSELVGFDPEPGVYCLAPLAAPGDIGRGVVARAAQRIAQVYGLPLLRYRCLELSVVSGSG